MVYRTQARSWFTQFHKVKFIYTLFPSPPSVSLLPQLLLAADKERASDIPPSSPHGVPPKWRRKVFCRKWAKCEETFEIFILYFMRAYSDNCLKHKMRTYSNYEVMCAEGKKFHSLMKASRRRIYIVAKSFLMPKIKRRLLAWDAN